MMALMVESSMVKGGPVSKIALPDICHPPTAPLTNRLVLDTHRLPRPMGS